jgi:diguanylate cyclase (GGDEF)-like protein/PAS domain S-box-containing protein
MIMTNFIAAFNFRKLPLISKLILLSLMTALISLITVFFAMIIYDQFNYKKSLEQEMTVLASIISNRSSAALVFEDKTQAAANLNTLAYREGVEQACLYQFNFNLGANSLLPYSHFPDTAKDCPKLSNLESTTQVTFTDNHLEIIEPVVLDDGIVGYLFIKFSLAEAQARIWTNVWLFIPITIAGGILGLALATILARRISQPIIELGLAAQNIAKNENYSVRATKLSDDEIGTVVDSFNAMLSMIERESKQLRESEERFRLISESSRVGIFQLDQNGRCNYANEELSRITGLTLEQLLADGWLYLIDNSDHDHIVDQFHRMIEQGRDIVLDCGINMLESGQTKWISGNVGPIYSQQQQKIGFLGTISDVTELKSAHEQLERMAFYDLLTGLANRRLFRNRLDNILSTAVRNNSNVGLIMMDLDHFKNVNDTLGHDSGDALLKIAADRIKHCVRFSDTVARLGGDEFAIILPNIADSQAIAVIAEKIIISLQTPVVLDGVEMTVSASVGIAISPDDGNTAEILTKNADMALYRAKDMGRNNYQFFTEQMNQMLIKRLEMIADMRSSIINEDFFLNYQPLMNIHNNTIMGFEALVRWQHPIKGMISPMDFIPLSEETNLIIPLGRWILKTAVQKMRYLQDEGLVHRQAVMTVNVSIKQFQLDDELVPYIEQVLAEVNLPAHMLELEITETLLMENINDVLPLLERLNAQGITLAIDDFGTGYSSLGYLKRLPIHLVKVDRSFVKDIPYDKDDMAITEAVIAMAHKLSYKVVAEGIETEDQLNFLREAGCDYGQGYLFSKPLGNGPLVEFCQTYTQQMASLVSGK